MLNPIKTRMNELIPLHSTNKLREVLLALGDVIRSQQDTGRQHEPTATEFFVVILKTLTAGGRLDENTDNLLRILAAVTPQAMKPVVREQFKGLSTTLLRIAQASSEHSKTLRLALLCLGECLKRQEASDGFWGSVHVLKTVNIFLSLIDDARPKLRKCVHDELVSILSIQTAGGGTGFASYLCQFCTEVLRNCTRSEYKRSLYVVLFLESCLSLLPVEQLVKLIDTMLQLQESSQSVLTASMFRTLDSFFQSPVLKLTDETLFEIVKKLLQNPPSTQDMEANTYYCTTLASALIRLHKQKPALFLALFPIAVQYLVHACEAEFTQVHCAVSTAIKRLVSGCIDEEYIQYTVQLHKQQLGNSSNTIAVQAANNNSDLRNVIGALDGLLQLRYQHAWPYAMDAIRSLFDRIRGEAAFILLGNQVKKLAEVYEAVENGTVIVTAAVSIALSETLGAMLRCCGVSYFLQLVPWTSPASPVYVGIDASREWLLRLFHDNLIHIPCRLEDFGTNVLTVARACNQAIANPESHRLDATQVSVIRNRVLQLWSLFPDFCQAGATDIAATFPKMAKILEGAMKDTNFPELLPDVVSGLTYIVKGVRERFPATVISPATMNTLPQDLAVLSAQATVFLPAILAFLESIDISDVRFQRAVQCASAWASVSPPALVSSVAKKLLQLLLTSTHTSNLASDAANETAAASWMAIMQAIIPYLPPQMIQLLYKTMRPLLSVDESISLQKRAYSVLEGLLRTHEEVIQQTESRMDILGVISNSLLNCHVSARSMRLRCLETLIEKMTAEEVLLTSESILGEVLICQKDANKKSRDSAMSVLRMLIAKVPSDVMLMQLCSGVVGETAVMRASAVIGMCVLLLEKRTETQLLSTASQLLPTVCILLRENCVEQTRAVLSFIRVCTTVFSSETLVGMLPELVPVFTSGLGPLKSKFSSRVRAIMRKLHQKVGEASLNPLVSEEDRALLQYIIKQERRAIRKKQKARDLKEHDVITKMLGSDSEESDEEDEDENAAITGHRGASAGDRRVVSRPVAVRASEVVSALPTSLDDLLEDQPAAFLSSNKLPVHSAVTGKSRKRSNSLTGATSSSTAAGGAGADAVEEEDDDGFNVVVAADGRVVVQVKTVDKKAVATAEQASSRKTARDAEDAKQNNNKSDNANSNKKQRKDPGEEYRSKKAGGDVWKKGMLEPHAYISLDPRLLSKKHQRDALGTFGGLLKSTAGRQMTGGKSTGGSHVTTGNRKQRRVAREHATQKSK